MGKDKRAESWQNETDICEVYAFQASKAWKKHFRTQNIKKSLKKSIVCICQGKVELRCLAWKHFMETRLSLSRLKKKCFFSFMFWSKQGFLWAGSERMFFPSKYEKSNIGRRARLWGTLLWVWETQQLPIWLTTGLVHLFICTQISLESIFSY